MSSKLISVILWLSIEFSSPFKIKISPFLVIASPFSLLFLTIFCSYRRSSSSGSSLYLVELIFPIFLYLPPSTKIVPLLLIIPSFSLFSKFSWGAYTLLWICYLHDIYIVFFFLFIAWYAVYFCYIFVT